MASGLPDYYRGVRPRYGGARFAAGSGAVGAGVGTKLVEVSGKGMIYGGMVSVDHAASQKDSKVVLFLQPDRGIGIPFCDFSKYGLSKDRSMPLVINRYDDTNHVYSVGVTYGLTFDEYVLLAYDEQHDAAPTVNFYLVYALI